MTEDLVDLCAQAEASLLRLIAALQGSDERAAQNLLRQKDAKEELLAETDPVSKDSIRRNCSRVLLITGPIGSVGISAITTNGLWSLRKAVFLHSRVAAEERLGRRIR